MPTESQVMPREWQVVDLGAIASLRRIQIKPATGDPRPYIGLEHIVSGGSLNGYGRAGDSISNKTAFRKGDTLYGKLRPNLRKVVRAEFDGVCSTDILVIFARDLADDSFLNHLLGSDLLHGHAMRGVAGTKMPRTSWSHLKVFSFGCPPLPEQRSIATVMDSIDEAIKRTETVIAATERLRDALLHELLTRGVPGWHTEWKDAPGIGTIPADWEVVRLGDVAEVVTSGSRAWSRYFRPDGALFVRSQNISVGTIDRSDAVFVQPPADAEAVRTRIRTGDLLVSITGEPGKVTVADDTLGHAYVSQHVALVRLSDPGLSAFASEFLRGRAGQDQFNRAAYGQTRPGLSLMNVNNTKVAFPPPSERDMIAYVGNSLKAAISRNMAGLNRLRSLRISTSDALLTGRLRIN